MDDAPLARPNRWQLSPARRLALEHERRDERARCAQCGTPAFRAFGDHAALRAWILEYRTGLAAELRDYFRKNPELHARKELWYGLLTAQLRSEVALAWERSELSATHGIEPGRFAVIEAVGAASFSDALRAFVVDGFVALVCAQCREQNERAAAAPEPARRRYAVWFFNGDLRAAQRADPVRWALLDEALASAFEDLAAVSERGK
ncbi:MAG: hypothetical protein JO225_15830 [Candidatus Eremiobacteraeota bacterium]|nr:hypothetical protein [Candidatus Eremiobacteraeota bacterium]